MQILTDPKQKRFFTRRDMKDLFSLDEAKSGESETARVFRDVAHEVYAADTAADDTSEGKASSQPSTDEEKDNSNESGADQGQRKRLKKAQDSGTGDVLPFDVEPFKEEGSSSGGAAAASSSSSAATPAADRLLSLLFSKGGITSAMSHDSIMEGSSRAEKSIAETVAKKVAERAVEALKKSREEMRGQPLSVPTWTGRNGYQPPAGGGGAAGGERKRFGTVTRPGMGEPKKAREGRDGERMRSYDDPSSSSTGRLYDHHTAGSGRAFDTSSSSSSSSSSLSSSAVLARLKQRTEQGHVAVSFGLPSAQSMSSIEERDARQALNSPAVSGLLDALCRYLEDRRDGVTTQGLIDAFADRLASDQDKFVFRQLLRTVARLDKSGRGEGKWKIKEAI